MNAKKSPTGNTTPSDAHLDRVDRLLAERRGEKFDDPEEITSREQVEEIARVAAEEAVKGRPPMPTPVQIVFPERPSSDPPSIRRRNAKLGAIGGVLAGIAAVITALAQCSHDRHPPVVPAMVHEAK